MRGLLAFGPWAWLLGPRGFARERQAAGIGSIDHVALPMRNTDAMLDFYRDLGCRVNETQGICSVHFGDQKINFHRPSLWEQESFTLRAPGARPPCGDLCFVWEGSAELLRMTLARARAEVIEGPVDRAGGRDLGTATGTSVYVRDPDGNLLEFMIYG
jgi:catechol 2,3-dioxygenase-like lactoylglutathione lyase family enzyme